MKGSFPIRWKANQAVPFISVTMAVSDLFQASIEDFFFDNLKEFDLTCANYRNSALCWKERCCGRMGERQFQEAGHELKIGQLILKFL